MDRTQALAQIKHGEALIRAGQEAIDAAHQALAQIDVEATVEEVQAARVLGIAADSDMVESVRQKMSAKKPEGRE